MDRSTRGISYYDLDRLCQEAVKRDFKGDGNTVGNVISQATYALCWAAFTKFCQSQIEVQRAVNIQNFAIIGFQPLNENSRIIYIHLDDAFLHEHGLVYQSSMADFEQHATIVLKPTTKPNFGVMAKNANMEKGSFHSSLLNMLHLIGELLSESQNVEIDLQEFGKFTGMNRQILYAPMNKMKPSGLQGKQTVKALMDFGTQGHRGGQLPSIHPRDSYEQQQLQHAQQQQYYQAQANLAYASSGKQGNLSAMLFKSGGQVSNHSQALNESPTRRFRKPYNDAKITSELLGAGDDPMAKNQEFSLLASNPAQLMRQNFKKPQKAQSRFPPVIDPFSRTLAAPVSSQRHYLSVSHRIGTNFTPSGKGFYIDVETRMVRYKDINDTGTKLDIVSDRDVEPADEAEEYESIMNPDTADPRRIAAREVSYNRYRQYVENEISVDVIAPIRQYWLTHIIELIPGDLHAVEKDRIEYLIDTMLNEINKDYFDSVRKSIIDYILKDENEMRRLGIQQVLNQPITWGDDFYKGIEPNEEWKHNVMMARMLMSENLCICSQATLELMRIWREKEYYKTYLVMLPTDEEKPVPLAEFSQMQIKQIEEVRALLNSDWSKSAVNILREELENLDKDQTKTFFDSVAALMSNQVRDLVQKSIEKYVLFFRKFKKEDGVYPLPEEIIEREYDPDTPFELTFLTLKLEIEVTANKQEIAFATSLDGVRDELVRIVTQMIEKINLIPRADTQIANSEKVHLWEIDLEDEIVTQAQQEIREILSENLRATQKAINVYDEFLFLLQEEARIDQFLENKVYVQQEFLDEIQRYKDTIYQIRNVAPYEIRMSMFLVECSDLNEQLVTMCEKLISKLLKAVHDHIFTTCSTNLRTEVLDITNKFQEKADTSKLLVKNEEYLEMVKTKKRGEIEQLYYDFIAWLMLLYKFPQFNVADEQSKNVMQHFSSAKKVQSQIENQVVTLSHQRREIDEKLHQDIKLFEEELIQVKIDVDKFKELQTNRKFEEHNRQISNINTRLARLQENQIQINEQQEDLEYEKTEFPQIGQCIKQIAPFQDLWALVRDQKKCMEDWNGNEVLSLVPDQVKETHKKMMGASQRLKVTFENQKLPKPAKLAGDLFKELQDFRKNMPLIEAFCVEGLQETRHIQKISELLGITFTGTENLKNLNTFNAVDHIEKIEVIADTSRKEHQNKKIMGTMKEEWGPIEFTTKAWRGSYILEGEAVENLRTLLDDHLIKTQTMKGSPHIGFMRDQVIEWENKLNQTNENLEVWLKVQSVWLYLEPVFQSDDIMKQMPVEGQTFQTVDRVWRKIMAQVNDNQNALDVIEIQDLGKMLVDCKNKLDNVQKGLDQYLERKRGAFPRFYFLSSDELLEILSQTKEPLKVQPHLKKLFEGITSLHFDDEKKIHAMFSSEGEKVQFIKIIDPVAQKSNVEEWLCQVEEVQWKSVKFETEKALQAYNRTEREKWVTQFTGMATLAVSMMFWTSQAEEVMKSANGMAGLQAYYEKLQKQLEGIVGVVRTKISALQRCTLEALVVLDVHAMAVIKDELIDQNICSYNDFAWLSQLRYYWEENDVIVKITNSTMSYNYEYLGNSARLVITPLTDRCYRTLCGAIYLNYGGAPEGPAGTGKTETVKDLSKALARQCIVFNCSDGLDYMAMAKFFKGLASCGAWSCFDEFNRIQLEVLSVIASQLQQIQMAVDRKLEQFEFEGAVIPLKLTCNCFITMNPGYAGRAELPDNLKALFRSVAMMVPDYGLIAQISLYSYGFLNAKTLSQKIVTTYKLCSEQLSSQHHYDYGMRAVKSVLTAAGNLKRKYIDEDESILMLRAINDVNLAKFLSHDLPLFKNITSDLFPGVVLPEPDYVALNTAIKNAIKRYNLQEEPYFIEKTIQLYEMIIVRHGLMVVGMPFAGKTSAMKVLAAALSELKEKGQMEEMKTHINIINPKSITQGQLYGNFDPVSHDWADGILAVWYRIQAAQMDTKERRWLVFDGPVDAVWIENMNTVLDDNKKLCLTSGEIIQMSVNMNMIFEPMDLAEASPATVSRCGMVYMQPHEMGWTPLYKSWKNTLPNYFHADKNESLLKNFDELIEVVVQPCLDFVRNQAHETTPTDDQTLVQGLLRLWRSLLNVFDDQDYVAELPDKKKAIAVVDSCFLFSVIWSLCITINTEYRRPFDKHLKQICNGELENITKFNNKKLIPSAMDRGTIYDYCYFPKEELWRAWMDLTKKEDIDKFPKNSKVQDLVVTTVDTIRYSYIQEHCIRNFIPTLFVGPTGTGKSVYIQNVLQQRCKREEYDTINIGFSAQTNCNNVQDIIDMNLTRRGRDIYGPRMPKKCIVFVDDLNMPKKEQYGAQPPIEILRQFMDQGGWYDRKDQHPFLTLIDVLMIAAMGPPGGGKSFISPRLQRHFNVVAFAIFDDNVMKSIFQSILKWYFRSENFNGEVSNMQEKLVAATLNVYKKIQEDLKPTPLKSHYTFNLRDVSKVICGICLAGPKQVESQDTVMRLWAHESTRVFGDRLINNEDRVWMLNCVRDCIRAPFGANFDLLFKHLDQDKDGKVTTLDEFRGNAFGDIYTPFGMTDRPYEEILDKERMQQCADDALGMYNDMSDKPMDLVLFAFAIEHLLRISRIIKQPGGHAMLVGVGGSGRQSLTKLASRIADFEVFQIEIKKQYEMKEFREDIKDLMRKVGAKGEPYAFIFTDNSIKEEGFLEDINNILNTGEVPNIFPDSEIVEVMELVRGPAKAENRCPEGTPQQLFAYFVERCKKNLHICLAFSPIGDSFRTRVRNFPSLVNCTTIDWFSEWPKDALESVAERFLGEIDLTPEVHEACVNMVQMFHTDTQKQAVKFLREQKRHYYVTPTSYLELITTFKSLLQEKRDEIMTLKNRYSNGYQCLIETENSVGKMQIELEAMQPKLIETSKEVEIKAADVEKQTIAAEAVKERVSKDEAVAQLAADEANGIKNECQEALAKATPALESAAAALLKINKSQIAELKQIRNVHEDALRVMTAMCILFDRIPPKKMNAATGKREQNFWPEAQKIMGDIKFLDNLRTFEKDDLTEKQIVDLKPYIEHEKFNKESMKNISEVAMGLCEWVLAMNTYYNVNLIVKPKKAQLEIALAKSNEVNAQLKIKQEELRKVEEQVNYLRANLKESQDEKARLEAEVTECEAKLVRATKLIQGLGGEKARWKKQSEDLAIVYHNLTGDVLIAAGMIAYLGAFNALYRDELAQSWVAQLEQKEIPNAGHFSLQTVLGDPVQIRAWTAKGLPSDNFSIENAIVTMKTRRWPLFIDPQGQANKWIRSMGKDKDIKILKFSEEKYLKMLEAAIRFGNHVLIENVGVELDPAIEPLLQKQIVKKAGSLSIKIGDSIIDYDKNFKLFMTTKLRNPHYLPEVSTKVTILNFMITFEGLSDQLLGIVVAKEEPELETQKEQLVIESAKYKDKLLEIENQILKTLQDSTNILGDASAIEILSTASELSVDIAKKQETAKKTETDIDEARILYKPIALRTAGLFFCIQDLAFIDPMYQYSLPFFINLFEQAIAEAEVTDELDQRIQNLNEEFLSSLYRNICRSLFEKDKVIFSLLLTIKLLELANEVKMNEFRFMLTGGVSLGTKLPDKPAAWLTDKAWGELNRACEIDSFKGFMELFCKDIERYEIDMFNSTEPQNFKYTLAEQSILNSMRKLIVLRCIRPDKLVPAMSLFVIEQLGEQFISPPAFDLPLIYKDSQNCIPLIFVLSPGVDPLARLNDFAEKKKRVIDPVSLGQGQGPKAEQKIAEAKQTGTWVVLQNCHLAVSWMPTLEKICEELSPDHKLCHRDFRLWLTSYPSQAFPVSILQNGVKMTNEAPKGLRSNLNNSFLVEPISRRDWFYGNTQPKKFRKLVFGLCFFHAVIQERRLYGALGWNIQYGFNETDLVISVRQLSIFIDEYPDKTPFEALRYLTGECNYGGRVTDTHDRRCLAVLLKNYYCENIFDDDYKFSPSGIYQAPPHGEYESYIEYAKKLPQYPEPEVFGLHQNAAISKNLNETNEMLISILDTQQSASAGGSEDNDAIINAVADSILNELPEDFDMKLAMKKYNVNYYQSFNTVLTQELLRFNGLTATIRDSLKNLKRAIKGEVLLSSELEQALTSIIDGMVPAMWKKQSYPTLKPLGGYIKDLKTRLVFFQKWLDTEIPDIFHIDLFFFTHGFLTGALQNYARSYKIAIDTLDMDFEVVFNQEHAEAPKDGIHVIGMNLEGCKWDPVNRVLAESDPKILYTICPMMWFKPVLMWDKKEEGIYKCPLYTTLERKGTLRTTGHSTNFVLLVHMPSDLPEAHWIKRGAAMILQLSE